MSREIRVTIDDDEVFERMKHRKQQLDLSWEEVLRRGLRRSPDRGDFDSWQDYNYRRPPGQERKDRSRGQGDLGEDIARHVQARVADKLRNSMEGVLEDVPRETWGPAGRSEFESELGSLEHGEDATLAFPFLDDVSANEIPLRVDLRTSANGLDVDVITIRRGKSVTGMNQFTPETRKAITKNLARGEDAVLRLATDDETYRVSPVLSWSRDSTGQPTITSVEIEDVMFD
jgi:hypothetical protein